MTASRMIAIWGLAVSFAGYAAACTSGGSPMVSTDQREYDTAGTVTISGCGVGLRAAVKVLVTGPDGRIVGGTVKGDERGEFNLRYQLPGRGVYTIAVVNAFGGVLASTAFNRSTRERPQQAGAGIAVNEIESNGGVPGDWVELYNRGSAAMNLAGFVVKDNDDTHIYTLPAGTMIAPGGYLVVDEADLGYGLGAADSVRLFDPSGALVDSYSWTAHAATTYGRCPNGSGDFIALNTVTKGSANDCAGPVKINEIESNGGVPGDWVELYNTGASSVDVSGWSILDNDDTHVAVGLPAGTTIPAGGFLVVEEADLGFGLGAADSVRLFDKLGALVETYSWTAHAATTYGRCPDGSGDFAATSDSTKGAPNNCGGAVTTVYINEVESNGGTPGDWIELINTGAGPVDISGWGILDNDDTHLYLLPPGSTIPAGGYLVIEEAAMGFGLGAADSVRVFDPAGRQADAYSWEAHAGTTYGRCPNGSGAFTATSDSTKGAANLCPGEVSFSVWPGRAEVQPVDGMSVFGGNLSGLMYEASGSATPAVMWAVRNGPSTLYRLIWNGTTWTSDSANGWGAGKTVLYSNGTGAPDAEGVTFAGTASSGGLYVSTERDNNVSGVSRNSILRFDPAATGTSLNATHEWNLTADLPVVGPNLGIEAITWIPDRFLVSQRFFDESKGRAYNPVDYANHGTGLFFVGVEANGTIYAYALDHVGGGFTRIATITTGFTGVMDIQFDRERNDLWAVCDDTCQGRSVVLRIDAATGKFAVARGFERPAMMPNLNNEGFAFAPLAECVNEVRPVFWADDGETGGRSIRRGTLSCTAF